MRIPLFIPHFRSLPLFPLSRPIVRRGLRAPGGVTVRFLLACDRTPGFPPGTVLRNHQEQFRRSPDPADPLTPGAKTTKQNGIISLLKLGKGNVSNASTRRVLSVCDYKFYFNSD